MSLLSFCCFLLLINVSFVISDAGCTFETFRNLCQLPECQSPAGEIYQLLRFYINDYKNVSFLSIHTKVITTYNITVSFSHNCLWFLASINHSSLVVFSLESIQ